MLTGVLSIPCGVDWSVQFPPGSLHGLLPVCLLPFLKFIFIYIYVYVRVGVRVDHACAAAQVGQKRTYSLWGLEGKVTVSCLPWVLGICSGSQGRAASLLNY